MPAAHSVTDPITSASSRIACESVSALEAPTAEGADTIFSSSFSSDSFSSDSFFCSHDQVVNDQADDHYRKDDSDSFQYSKCDSGFHGGSSLEVEKRTSISRLNARARAVVLNREFWLQLSLPLAAAGVPHQACSKD